MKKIAYILLVCGILSCNPVVTRQISINYPKKLSIYDTLIEVNSKIPKNSSYMTIHLFQESKKYNFNVNFSLAVIQQESRFDSSAISSKNCANLLQLNPKYFPYCKTRDNISQGLSHLRWCFDKAKQDTVLSLASYNYGRRRALNTPKDEYPKETLNYIKKVLQYYKEYKNG